MNKKDFIKEITGKTGYTQKDINTVLNAITEVVTEAVIAGKEVTLWGLGKFVRVDKPERGVRNPKTGESITIPARREPKFKISSTFKNAVINAGL